MPTNLCEDGSDYSYLLIIQHPRYYGFFSPGLRPRLAALREKFNTAILEEPSPEVIQQPDILPTSQQGDEPSTIVRCLSCGQPMQRQRSLFPLGCRPP